MKLLIASDTHGNLPPINGSGDIFIHTGDVCPNWSHIWTADWPYQAVWLEQKFVPWLQNINAKHKLILLGNHDSDRAIDDFKNIIESVPGTQLMIDKSVKIMGKNIYGSSYSHASPDLNQNNRWGFGGTEEQLQKIYDQIPDDTEILLSHGPAFGILDATKWQNSYTNIGSQALRNRLFELEKLQLVVCGHEHYHGGQKVKLKNTLFVNSALNVMEIEI